MEVECALRIRKRLIGEHSLRYTTMLSDGDSKAHGAVCDANVYGDRINIEKKDCINHDAKWLAQHSENCKCIKETENSNNWQRQLIQPKDKKNSKLLWKAIKTYSSNVPLL